MFGLRKGVSRTVSKLSAKIRLQTAILLARDIQSYRNGDKARFDRMVDSHGKGIIKLEEAIEIILRLCQDTSVYFPASSGMLKSWVIR